MPGNSTSTQTFTQNAQPWGPQADRLRAGFDRAENLYNQGPLQFFPGQTFVGFSPQTEQALSLAENRALTGSPLTGASQQQLQQTLGGDYLRSNPAFNYLESTARGDFLGGSPAFDRYKREITDAVNAQFGASGRTGGGYHTGALAQGLGDAAAGLYAQERANQLSASSMLSKAFGDERARQMQGLAFAPSVAQQDYTDIAQLANVGAQREALDQARLEDQIQRHNFGQEAPYDQLGRYFGFVGGNYGGQTTGTQPVYRNQGVSGLGGALLGAGLGSQLGFGTGGSAALAGLGGLIGFL